ncbi:MAG: response regulator transcription factor, partial [Rubrobacter sp.]
DSGGEAVVHAIRAVASGEAVFGPGVAERIMGFFSAPKPITSRRAFPELTEREEEVLSLVAKGKSNQEIARQLFVTLKTVRNHVSHILLKLHVADRTQAVIRARDAGLR